MPTEPLHLVVDARYASAAFPGIGRVTRGLAHAWADHPGIAALHLITNPAAPQTHAALPAPSATVHHHPLTAPPRSSAEARQVRALVNRLPVDWFVSPYLRIPWGSYTPRTLVMVHDAIPLQAAGIPLATRLGYAAALRNAACRADVLVTVSAHAAAQLQPWLWPHPRPAVVPNGVDTVWPTRPVDLTAHGIRGPYALCVSSNQPHKNLTGLVAAWQQLRHAGSLPPTATLVICGHFDPRRDQPWQTDRATTNPIVAIADADDATVHALYRHAQLVVHPSRAEGFGLPVYEALAHGRLVVADDLPVYRAYAPGMVEVCAARRAAALAAAIAAGWHADARRAELLHTGPAAVAPLTWAAAADAYVTLMHKNATGR